MHNIFAYTEATPDDGFPADLSINRDNNGRLFITVRSRGKEGREIARIEVTDAVLARLAVVLLDPRKRLGHGGSAALDGGE